MKLTQREAYFLYKNLQYQMAKEKYEKIALAGGKDAFSSYQKDIAELDYIYGEEESLPDKKDVERMIDQWQTP